MRARWHWRNTAGSLSPRCLAAMGLAAGALISASDAGAQLRLLDNRLAQRANAVLSLMAYSVVPDLASSSLSVQNAETDNPGVYMTQLGGGDTISKSIPIYLEGAIAYSRYDPTFIATN